MLIDLKTKVNSNSIVFSDFNNLLSLMDCSSGKNNIEAS